MSLSSKCLNEGDSSKMSEYIGLVSGVSRREDVNQPDHTYARSSIWRPSNHLAEPCRFLFFPPRDRSIDEEDVDVETVTEEPLVPLLCSRAASEPVGEEHSSLEEDDDGSSWVDKISKVGWSPVQIRILPKVMHIIEDFQLCRLVYKERPNEEFLVESAVVTGASKLSHLLASVSWDRAVVQWLHALLLKHLTPVDMDDYLLLLNLVKKKYPLIVDKMTTPTHVGRVTPVKEKTIEQLLKVMPVKNSLTNQVAEVLLDEQFDKLPHDPIFVVIPNSLESSTTDRFSVIMKQLHQMASVHIVSYSCHTKTTSIMHSLDQMVAETRTLLADVCSSANGRPVLLIGWNVGAAIACLVSQLERVQGIVCLGYPFRGMDWNHNNQQSNSSIVEVSCPILFIVGAQSEIATQEDMEDMRLQMRVPTQLVIVCGCNTQLIMSHKDSVKLRVTQSMVDRSLVVEIYNFVGELLTKPPLPPPRPGQNTCVSTVVKHLPVTSYKKKIREPPAGVRQLSCKTTFVVSSRGRKPSGVVSCSPLKRKARVPPSQKLILFNSAKYLSLLPHHNYAARYQLQPLTINNQRSVLPK